MKSFFLSVAVFSIVSINCFAQKTISVEDIWSKYAFMPASAGGFNAMKDGLHYTDLEKEGDFDNIVKLKKLYNFHYRVLAVSSKYLIIELFDFFLSNQL